VRKPRQPKIYATLRRRFAYETLVAMGFTWDSRCRFVKLGARRTELAYAVRDGQTDFFSVTPMVRHWR
jgi:hypothetical protein